jgi:hypothetical protein
LLLKAYAEAAVSKAADAQCFDDAIKNKDVAQAQAVIHDLQEEAKRCFTAAGGRDFDATVNGLVKFMEDRSKTNFGKQAMWTNCCERRLHELLVSNDPAVQTKLAKAAEAKSAAIAKAAELTRSKDLLSAVFQRHASPARVKVRMSELGHPMEFLNTPGQQMWHKSHHMIDITLQAVRGFVGTKLAELHADYMKRAADENLSQPDASWKSFFDLEEPSNAGLPQGEWLLLLKKTYHDDAMSGQHRVLFSNTDARLLADPREGPIEIGKFFATTLGGSEKSSKMKAISDLDAEATFNIVKNCSFFDRKVREEAAKAVQSRNDVCHRKTMSLDPGMCESVYVRLRGFLELVPGCEDAVVALEQKYKSNIRYVDQGEFQRFEQEHKQLQEFRQRAVDSFFKNTQEMCSEVDEVVKRCLRDWPHADSRRKLLDEIAQTSLNAHGQFQVTWMQGHRGSGKSSAICKLRQEMLQGNDFVLHHSFIRSDSSSSLQVAVTRCCEQLLQVLLRSIGVEDDRKDILIEVMTDLIGSFDPGLGKMEIRQLLLSRDVAQLCDVLVKLLRKVNEEERVVKVVIFLDAIDEVFERYETADGFENSDRTLQLRVLDRLRAGVALFEHLSVSVVASSTQAPPSGLRCDVIRVDEARQFFGSGDIDLLIDKEYELLIESEAAGEEGAVPFWANCAVEFMKVENSEGSKVNCPAVSDLRLLRTWVKLTFKIARMLSGAQELQHEGGLSEDQAAYLRERLAVLKVTKMDQVVQMYLFQCMLNAFPDDDPEAWYSGVDVACRVMLLTAYLGVDCVDLNAFEFFFRRGPHDYGWRFRTVECVGLALRDFIVRCEGRVVVFQPFYMDVFRRSLIVEKTGGSSADDDESSGSFQELFKMVKHDSPQSSHLRLRTSKKKYLQLFYKYELAFSDVRGLVHGGLQMLRDLEQAAGAVPLGVWRALVEHAMHGESCSCISFIVRVLVEKYPDEKLPRLCSEAFAAIESALSYRRTRGGESGVWCFEIDQAMKELSRAVKAAFRCGISPVFWKTFLPSIVTFLSKHAEDDSVLDVIQFAKWLDVITGKSSGADKERALERMVAAGVKPDAATWTRVIAGYSNVADKERALERMVAAGIQPYRYTWDNVIAGYSSGDERERALERMVAAGVQPTAHMWSTVIDRYSSGAEREIALKRMAAAGVLPDASTWKRVIKGYSSGDERERALERMVAAGVQPTAHMWSTVIDRYSTGAEKEKALERMVATGVQPDADIWGNVIAGYSSGADKERVLERMVATGVQPDAHTWEQVIAGYLNGADKERVLERMVAAGVRPYAHTWTTSGDEVGNQGPKLTPCTVMLQFRHSSIIPVIQAADMSQAIKLQLPQRLAKALRYTSTLLGKMPKYFVFLNFKSIETAAEAMSHVNEVLAGKLMLGGNIYNVKADWEKRMRERYSSAIDRAIFALRQASAAAALPSTSSSAPHSAQPLPPAYYATDHVLLPAPSAAAAAGGGGAAAARAPPPPPANEATEDLPNAIIVKKIPEGASTILVLNSFLFLAFAQLLFEYVSATDNIAIVFPSFVCFLFSFVSSYS